MHAALGGVHRGIRLVTSWSIVLFAFVVAGEAKNNKTVTVGGASFLFFWLTEIAFLAEEDDLAEWLVGG